jgi:hypothetical protein
MEPRTTPWTFFLSYSHADADGLLKGFAGDLNETVERRLRISPPAGFVDRNDILLGMDWNDRLGEALRISLVLVCLVSTRYLQSESCGRELDIFLKRRALLPADTNGQVILPVFWESPTVVPQLPESLRTFQDSDSSLPETYLTWGARSVAIKRDVDSKRRTDPYQRLLTSLSIKIGTAATECRLPELSAGEMPAFSKLSNAFLPSAPLAPANSNRGRVYEINFVYGIPAAGDLPAASRRESYSALGGWYWQPFSAVDEGIGQMVYQAPARYRRHEHTVIKENLVDELIERGNQDQLVILLADPQAVLNPAYLAFFRRFDSADVPNSAILAIGADDRSESKLAMAFEKRYTSLNDTPYFRSGVTTKEGFLQLLGSTLDKLMDDVMKRRRSGNRFPGPELRRLTPPGRAA